MIFRIEDKCKFCANYLLNQTCKAFPENIPEEIWRGDVDHDSPIEGDNGYQFEWVAFEIPHIDGL